MRLEIHFIFFCLLLLGSGCSNGSGLSEESQSDADAAVVFEVNVEIIEDVPTVAAVEWRTSWEALDEAHISFGLDAEYGMTAPVDSSGSQPYRTLLLGMKPGREYHFKIVAKSGQETISSGDFTLETGFPPNSLPAVYAEVPRPERAEKGFILTSNYVAPPSVMILDSDGEYVWWHLAQDETGGISRAHMAADGESVMFWATNLKHNPNQKLYRVGMEGEDLGSTPLAGGHHDFVPLPDGSLAYIEFDVRDVDGVSISGDRIMEMAPDGSKKEIYSLWGDFVYSGRGGDENEWLDWSHSNAINFSAEDDSYYVSVLNFDAILKIDRKSGELLWVLGGDFSDFEDSSGDGRLWNRQHQFQVLDGSIILFNNGLPSDPSSKALEIKYDETERKMESAWSYAPNPGLFSSTFGAVQRLPGGNILVTFSNSGQIDEVTPDGELVRRINFGLKGALGYAKWLDTLYAGSQD